MKTARAGLALTVLAALFGALGCGARPVDDSPALATATAIPAGAPGAVGPAIPTSPIGPQAADDPPPPMGGDVPKQIPDTPFAPEHPTPVPPQPSGLPHTGPPKKTNPKGITL